MIGGQRYGAMTRIDALRELRFLHGDDGGIALHLRPELTLAQVRALLSDTKKSGAKRVAVVARAPQYPWERRVYWVAEGAGVDTSLRPTDSLQLLLHTIDHVGRPGRRRAHRLIPRRSVQPAPSPFSTRSRCANDAFA